MPETAPAQTFGCQHCEAVLASQRELDNHLCLLHDECGDAHLGSPITYRCATCGEAFGRRRELYAHQQQSAHGHPGEWDMALPPGTRHLHRSRQRGKESNSG